MVNSHGGKRVGAGRKELPDSLKKEETKVVRVPLSLEKLITKLKDNPNLVTINQHELAQLHAELALLRHQIRLSRHDKPTGNATVKANQCQAITRTGNRCTKVGCHENKFNNMLVMTCERHYQSMINKGVAHD